MLSIPSKTQSSFLSALLNWHNSSNLFKLDVLRSDSMKLNYKGLIFDWNLLFFIFRHRLQLSTTVSCMRDTRPHSLASTVSQDSIRVTQQVFPSISSSYWMPASEAAKDQMCHFHPTLLTIGNKQTISRSRLLVLTEVANYSMFPVCTISGGSFARKKIFEKKLLNTKSI